MKKLKDMRARDWLLIGAAAALALSLDWFAGAGGDPAQAGAPAGAPAAAWPQAGAASAPPAGVAGVHAATAGGGMRRAAIVDAAHFGRPLTAYTLEIPGDWQGGGELSWSSSSCRWIPYSIRFEARSADATQTLELLPTWFSRSAQADASFTRPDPGCVAMPFSGVRDYLQYVAQQRHPNGRILDYAERPDIVAEQQRKAPLQPMAPSPEMQVQKAYEVGQILIGWEENGRPMREMILAVATRVDLSMSMMGRTERARDLLVPAALVLRAPDGALDFALAERVRGSTQVSPEWRTLVAQAQARESDAQTQALIAGHEQRMANIQAMGAAGTAAHNARMAAADASLQAFQGRMAVMDGNQAAFQNHMDSMDVRQRQSLEAIGEYNTYRGVDGADVRASIHGGDRVFQNETFPDQVYSSSNPYAPPADGYRELQRDQ